MGVLLVRIRRIAVEQFTTVEVELPEKPMRAAMYLLDWIVALEPDQWGKINIDGNSPPRWWLALHDRPTPEMGLDVGVMRRHQSDDRLT
jgi:hypothetical protein